MDKYIWIFPVLFIFHDMEELILLIIVCSLVELTKAS